MKRNYTELIARIREECQRDGWYGGYLDSPTCLYVRPDHSQRMNFAYPSASGEQLQETESVLGFRLPSLLRTLYAEVANGGVGPGAGISGALGGYGSRPDDPDMTIVDDYYFHNEVDIANLEHIDSVRLVDLADNADGWKPTTGSKKLLLIPYGQSNY